MPRLYVIVLLRTLRADSTKPNSASQTATAAGVFALAGEISGLGLGITSYSLLSLSVSPAAPDS